MNVTRPALTVTLCTVLASALHAEPPQVVSATAAAQAGAWRISVTLRHPDTGWDHYADGWRVETADGTVLGTRELLHPHVTEQPFTRGLGPVAIPAAMPRVFIRARCNVTGWSDETHAVDIAD